MRPKQCRWRLTLPLFLAIIAFSAFAQNAASNQIAATVIPDEGCIPPADSLESSSTSELLKVGDLAVTKQTHHLKKEGFVRFESSRLLFAMREFTTYSFNNRTFAYEMPYIPVEVSKDGSKVYAGAVYVLIYVDEEGRGEFTKKLDSRDELAVPKWAMATESQDSAVQFFYHPEHSDYFHAPLVFKVVEEGDPRLNTAPPRDVGRTVYITSAVMKEVESRLFQSRMVWDKSTAVQALETYNTIHSYGGMSVRVLSSQGTASATIPPKDICSTLSSLDPALHTPRALWEFQYFRWQYQCPIPGFDVDAYPEREP